MVDTSGETEKIKASLIEVAIESWRFSRLFSRMLNTLDAGETSRYANQLRYFKKKVSQSLEDNGLTMLDVAGESYGPGIAASALNISDFDPDDHLIVDQMVEPIIMGADGVCKTGTVMLRKASK